MSPVKDISDNKLIYLFPMWVRVVGVICFVFAAGFGYALVLFGIVDRVIVLSIFFACVAFFFFLGGVYCCKTTEVTFDHTGGRINIRKGLGPFWWGTLHLPKEQLEEVTVKDAADVAWGWLLYQSGEEAVSMRVKGRKRPINIITMDNASYLRRRIAEFLRGSSKDS